MKTIILVWGILYAIALSATVSVSLTVTPVQAKLQQLTQTREVCRESSTVETCESHEGCEWFIPENKCIDAPVETCWKLEREECNNHPGCRYFPEDREYFPPSVRFHPKYPVHVRSIGCRKQTMCDMIPLAEQCEEHSWCSWLDGRCQQLGSNKIIDYFPKCWQDGTYKKTCEQLGDQCEWVHIAACNSEKCESIIYGCRHKYFCELDKGDTAKQQCMSRPMCQWNKNENSCELAPPSSRPTPAPTTPTPTAAPTTPKPTVSPSTPPPTPLRCPTSDENNQRLVCSKNMGGVLEPPGQNRFDRPIADYCGRLCLDYQGPTDEFPLWAGCRSWNWDKNREVCVLNNCFPDGNDELEADVESNDGWRSGVLSSECFPNDEATQSPTISSCEFENTRDPPNFSFSRTSEDCRLLSYQVNNDMVGSVRTRLDWCEEKCSNNVAGCIATEFISFRSNARVCEFFSCTDPGSSTGVRVYRSAKSDETCGV